MLQFDVKIMYVKGELNTAADGLSCIPVSDDLPNMLANSPQLVDSCCGTILPTHLFSNSSNTVLKAVAALTSHTDDGPHEPTVLNVSMDVDLLQKIHAGYAEDP